MRISFSPAGHILGAATVALRAPGTSIAFSGDVGRPDDPVTRPPAPLGASDYIVVEFTYGDRLHDRTDPHEGLGNVIAKSQRAAGSSSFHPSRSDGRRRSCGAFIA